MEDAWAPWMAVSAIKLAFIAVTDKTFCHHNKL